MSIQGEAFPGLCHAVVGARERLFGAPKQRVVFVLFIGT